jgi:hypothetical protein
LSGTPEDSEIVIKRTGRRARLEITSEDLGITPRSGPATPPPGGVPQPPSHYLQPRPSPPTARRPPVPPATARPTAAAPTPPNRSLLWPLVGAATLLTAAVVAAVVLLSGKDDSERISKSLADAHALIEPVVRSGDSVARLRAIAETGKAADEARQKLAGAPEAALQGLPASEKRDAALAVLRAEREYVTSLAALRGVNRKLASEARLRGWEAIKRGVAEAQQRVLSTSATFARINENDDAPPPLFKEAQLASLLARLDEVMTTSNKALRSYQRALSKYRTAKRRAEARAAKIRGFGDQVISVINQYSNQRKEVAEWARTAALNYRPDDAVKARDAINLFRTQRQNTLSKLYNLKSLAPTTELETLIDNFEAPLTLSMQGLDMAERAADELAGFYDDPSARIDQTSAWEAFMERWSPAAENEIDAQLATWRQAVDSAAAEAASDGVPAKPRPPKV